MGTELNWIWWAVSSLNSISAEPVIRNDRIRCLCSAIRVSADLTNKHCCTSKEIPEASRELRTGCYDRKGIWRFEVRFKNSFDIMFGQDVHYAVGNILGVRCYWIEKRQKMIAIQKFLSARRCNNWWLMVDSIIFFVWRKDLYFVLPTRNILVPKPIGLEIELAVVCSIPPKCFSF